MMQLWLWIQEKKEVSLKIPFLKLIVQVDGTLYIFFQIKFVDFSKKILFICQR